MCCSTHYHNALIVALSVVARLAISTLVQVVATGMGLIMVVTKEQGAVAVNVVGHTRAATVVPVPQMLEVAVVRCARE